MLVAGGAGFLGAHLIAVRLGRGDVVHVLVRPTTDLARLARFGDAITVHPLALTDRAAVDRAVAAACPDSVFHLAVGDRRAMRPNLADALGSVDDDLAGLLVLLAACAAAARPPQVFVRAGSLAEYGPIAAPYEETQREHPESAYAAGQVAASHYMAMLGPRLPFAAVTARLALVYGPGQSQRFLLPGLIEHCLAGEPSRIARSGDRRDLIHVDDAIAGLEALAARPEAPVVNICTGIAPAMADVAALVCEATGADPRLVELATASAQGGVPDLRGSGALARRVCRWSAQIPLAEGIARTVQWHRVRARQVETC
ncbi:NAD-dependent epimerase/dehydratase family protein [Sandarakinorhabdus glacialis]|uniref:NAD-dependent epimerase/dehydratase family protein n=1 Tax=Sandarakinorhabdus glacialis TaxID=1614636 RepID=UPI00166743B2|nr:NAD(P)-dependent oxidoreductase [Polymorphobacter glacialis]